MRISLRFSLVFSFSFSLCPLCFGGEFSGLRVPNGFEVTQFADAKLANDIFCMAFDPRGRVVVSGPGIPS